MDVNLESQKSRDKKTDEECKGDFEAMKSHYREMMKLKNERIDKLNEKINELETENETKKDEVYELKEENQKIRKEFQTTETKRIEAEATVDNEKRKYSELEQFYEKWKEIDISDCFLDGSINEELLRKRLQFDAVQNKIQEENIENLKDIISSMECQIRLHESIKKQSTNSSPSIFDNIFGKAKLKAEIEKLASENTILKEKEENITKLFKVHQLEKDERNKVLNEKSEKIIELTLKLQQEQVRHSQELSKMITQSKPMTITVQDESIVEELAQLQCTLQNKEIDIETMTIRINNLIDENKKLKDDLTRVSTVGAQSDRFATDSDLQVQSLLSQLNRSNLEYEQMELKYNDAIEQLTQLQNKIEHLSAPNQSIDLCPEIEPRIEQTSNFGNQLFRSPLNVEKGTDNHNQQVYSENVIFGNCPCCDISIPMEDIEVHLEMCLEQQN